MRPAALPAALRLIVPAETVLLATRYWQVATVQPAPACASGHARAHSQIPADYLSSLVVRRRSWPSARIRQTRLRGYQTLRRFRWSKWLLVPSLGSADQAPWFALDPIAAIAQSPASASCGS